MMRFFGWVMKWTVVLGLLIYIGVVMPWNSNNRIRAELAQANAIIAQLQDQIDRISTSDYSLELTNEVCVAGVWTVELDSFIIHTDRATYEACQVGSEFPCVNSFSNFLMTTRLVVTDMDSAD